MTGPTTPALDFDLLAQDPAREAARVCTINVANLDQAIERHPALFAYVHSHWSIAKAAEEAAKWKYEQAVGDAFSAARLSGEALGAAKIMSTQAIPVQELKMALLACSRFTRQLDSVVRGMEHRRDMLVQLSARDRQTQRQLT